jgi:hypothetical protein
MKRRHEPGPRTIHAGSEPSPARRGSSTNTPAAGSIKRAARDVAARARDRAARALSQAQEQTASAIDRQLESASDRLESVAAAFRQTASTLDHPDEAVIARLIQRAAGGVEGAADYIRENDVGDMVEDAEDFVRRHPVLVLGGALLAGAVVGRLLRASNRPNVRRSERQDSSSSAFRRRRSGNRGTFTGGRQPRRQHETDRASEAGPRNRGPIAQQYGASHTPGMRPPGPVEWSSPSSVESRQVIGPEELKPSREEP